MSSAAVFDLLPFLLPEAKGKLLILGEHPALEKIDFSDWDDVVLVRKENHHAGQPSSSLVEEGLAQVGGVLAIDEHLLRRELTHLESVKIPITLVGRGSPPVLGTEIIRKCNFTLYGFPLLGRPLVWTRSFRFTNELTELSPRGRFDLTWLSMQRLANFLPRFGLGWHVSGSASCSIIGSLLQMAGINGNSWQHTRTGQIIVMNDTNVVKIPLHNNHIGLFHEHMGHLNEIRRSVKNPEILELIPADQQELRLGKYVALVERRLPGHSAFHHAGKSSKRLKIFRSAIDFLERWYSPPCPQITINEQTFDEFWVQPLVPLADALQQQGNSTFWSELVQGMSRRIMGRTLPTVPVHGDFWLNNILVDGDLGRISGIVDWDYSDLRGLPLLDLFHLLLWRTHRFLPDFSVKHIERIVRGQDEEIYEMLLEHCDRIGLDKDWIIDLFCRYWLGQVSQRVEQFVSGNKLMPLLKPIYQTLI